MRIIDYLYLKLIKLWRMQYIQNIIEDIGESAAEDIALETCNMLAKSCGFPITVIGSAVKYYSNQE